ncbi:MAG: tRNA (adenosine(37)-N6)-dimethylallyltransferase MiaA [Nitrospinae bacterium]|nr:tRNA (adenosine(37)-N6)-dimethylallyltransferase MiaA [Nitrospinota bacterium]
MVRPILVILGPTAVGKTDLSLALAHDLDAEIVGADSRQLYRFLDIGTAKPSVAQRQAVPHHLIDVVNPDEPLNAAMFSRMAWACIRAIEARGKRPLVVGGSGLYIRALTDGLFTGPSADRDLRASLEAEANLGGIHILHDRLAQVDPQSARRIHPHDRVRIIRALEVYTLTGTPISEWQRQWHPPQRPQPFVLIGLQRDRHDLRARIAARTQAIIRKGLVTEVRWLLAEGFSPGLPPLRSVGYAEIIAYLAGEYSLTEAQALIARNTWHLAKRQMTWFRRVTGIRWVSLTGVPEAAVVEAVQAILADALRSQEGSSMDGRRENAVVRCPCVEGATPQPLLPT